MFCAGSTSDNGIDHSAKIINLNIRLLMIPKYFTENWIAMAPILIPPWSEANKEKQNSFQK